MSAPEIQLSRFTQHREIAEILLEAQKERMVFCNQSLLGKRDFLQSLKYRFFNEAARLAKQKAA